MKTRILKEKVFLISIWLPSLSSCLIFSHARVSLIQQCYVFHRLGKSKLEILYSCIIIASCQRIICVTNLASRCTLTMKLEAFLGESESVIHSVMSNSLWPMDSNPPGSSVHGILQARILVWVAIPFSRGSSQLRDQTQVSCTAGRLFTNWATREARSLTYWTWISITAKWSVEPWCVLGQRIKAPLTTRRLFCFF